MEAKVITLDELKAFKLKRDQEDWNLHPEKYNHDFNNGWYSTSKKNPSAGGIFMPIQNGAVVQFKTKYSQIFIGIITQFYFEKTTKSIMFSVMSNSCGLGVEPSNYLLSPKDKSIKILEGNIEFNTEQLTEQLTIN